MKNLKSLIVMVVGFIGMCGFTISGYAHVVDQSHSPGVGKVVVISTYPGNSDLTVMAPIYTEQTMATVVSNYSDNLVTALVAERSVEELPRNGYKLQVKIGRTFGGHMNNKLWYHPKLC